MAPTGPGTLHVSAAAGEEFRRLAGEFQLSFASMRTVLVTAAGRGEGATTVAASLARGLVETARTRILLVDANVRAPAVHRCFGVDLAPGFRDWEGKGAPPYQPTRVPNLFVLTAGTRTDTAVFWADQSARLGDLVKQMREHFDLIVWDSPPVARHPEALLLATLADAVLLVVESDQTRIDTLKVVREQLARVDARLLGVVMNRRGKFLPRAFRSRHEG